MAQVMRIAVFAAYGAASTCKGYRRKRFFEKRDSCTEKFDPARECSENGYLRSRIRFKRINTASGAMQIKMHNL